MTPNIFDKKQVWGLVTSLTCQVTLKKKKNQPRENHVFSQKWPPLPKFINCAIACKILMIQSYRRSLCRDFMIKEYMKTISESLLTLKLREIAI